MQYQLPGTTIEVRGYSRDVADTVLENIFQCKGVVLSQVAVMTGVEPHDVQNWVKRRFLTPPQHRQYTRRQFTRVAIINMLRETMQIDNILRLLSYINGALDDESDDSIDDCTLYNLFVNLLGRLGDQLPPEAELAHCCDEELSDFEEKIPDSRRRIKEVLMVMVYAYYSACAKRKVDELMKDIKAAT